MSHQCVYFTLEKAFTKTGNHSSIAYYLDGKIGQIIKPKHFTLGTIENIK